MQDVIDTYKECRALSNGRFRGYRLRQGRDKGRKDGEGDGETHCWNLIESWVVVFGAEDLSVCLSSSSR